jgi:iron complex outermembrane receptor protein
MLWGRLLLGFLLASLPATVDAQARQLPDLTVEELMRIEIEPVFGASKRIQPVTEAPASVTIVTADEIARYGYQTLADVLGSVRGFYVANDRNYSWLGQRGVLRPGDYNTHVLLLVDGHRMNDDIYEMAAIGRDVGLDTSMFERVEIVRGPSSSLYGTSAFFAVVNVIMRDGASMHGLSVSADTGTLGSRGVHVAGGKKLASGLEFSLAGGYSGTNGQARLYIPAFDTPETNGGIAEHLDDERAGQVFGRVKVARFTVTGAYGQRDKGVPTASYGSAFNDPRLRTTDRRGFIDAEYARTINATDVIVRGSLDHYQYRGVYPQAPVGDPVSALHDYAIGTWAAVEARLTRRLPGRQQLTAGGEFRDYFSQKQGETVDGSPAGGFRIDGSTKLGAGYIQDEIWIHPAIGITLGARYDVYAGFSHITPRAAVVVRPSPHQSFKYLYGTAFRAPNAFEYDLYSAGVRNRQLRPETMTSHEVVWERYVGTWLRTSASLYRNRVADVLTLHDDPGGAFNLGWSNVGQIHSQGMEIEGEWRFRQTEALGSYALQQSIDPDTNISLTNSPRHVAKLRFSTRGPVLRSTIAFETQYLSRRSTLAGGSVAPSAVANITFVEPLHGRMEMVAAIRNAFDTAYAIPGSKEHRQDVIEQNGRTFSIGVRWRLATR